jgi:hypothetical protein
MHPLRVFTNCFLKVGFHVLTAVIMNSTAMFWDIAPCSPYVTQRFGRAYHLHLQGRKSAEQETCVQEMARYAEDGGDTFFRNVCSHTDYTALYPRAWATLMFS